MAMQKRSSTLFTLFFLPLLAFVILAVAYAGITLVSLPQQAKEKFGSPASGLSEGEVYLLALRLIWQEDVLRSPTDPNGAPLLFKVELGEPAASVIQRLEDQGLITSANALRLYLQYSGLDTTLQAGEYMLSPALSSIEIAAELQDPTPQEVRFSILAGWRIEEIAASLSYTGLPISEEAFISAAQSGPVGYSFSDSIPPIAGMEGFLYPGEYDLPRDLSAPELLAIFLERFEDEVSPELRQDIEAQDLTLFEGVSLASIVEREAIVEEEMPAIAAVYLNRLWIGMKLDADPTVQYAVGYNAAQGTWWTNPLSTADLAFESLYNTYLYPAFPPGPIANPSLEALQAVAHPEDSPYYYFRARCDGSGLHNYAVTYEEHVANACK